MSSSERTDNAKATALRAGVQNPSGSNYLVAGPTIGGTATPYNPDNIEVAKERLADSLSKTSIQDNTQPIDHSLKTSVVSGAKTVAAGAAAAGAATVSAVKNLLGDKHAGTTTTTTTAIDQADESPHPHPIADFSSVSNIPTSEKEKNLLYY